MCVCVYVQNVCCVYMCETHRRERIEIEGDRQKEKGKGTGRARKTKRECHRKMSEIEGV